MAEKASSEFRGLGISRASASARKEKERQRETLRKILDDDYDSPVDDSPLIRDENLAYGFDLDFSGYGPVTLVKSTWGVDYDMTIFARLGLQSYNFHKGTNYKFVRWEKYNCAYFKFYITLEARDPSSPSPISFQTLVKHVACTNGVTTWRTLACRIKCNEALDDVWDDTAINPSYKCQMPQWLPHDYLSYDNHKYYYVVQESEIQENEWLHLFTEIAFYLKTNHHLNDSPPLVIKSVVVETKEGFKSEAREKLKAENALFFISYESSMGCARAIIRKTMDGKPGHMCLDVADRTEEDAK